MKSVTCRQVTNEAEYAKQAVFHGEQEEKCRSGLLTISKKKLHYNKM